MSTVAGGSTAKSMTLHCAGEAFATADRSDINEFALLKDLCGDLLANGEVADIVEPQLNEGWARLNARLVEVPSLGHGELSGILHALRDLDGAVAVGIRCLDLNDTARGHAQNGDRDDSVLLVPDLRHADLFADDRLGGHGCFLWVMRGQKPRCI